MGDAVTDTLIHRPGEAARAKPAIQPLAIDAKTAAAANGVSRSQWWKLHTMGRIPAPVYLGTRKPVWIVKELEEWAAAGMPGREAWEKLKRTKARLA
jgi:predicted DNA-binding transcriptional regulator AlpA